MPLERGAPRRGLLWAQPDYSIYHTREDLLKQVADIVAANPSFMKEEVLSAKDGNYGAELKVVTVEPGGFTDRKDKVHMLLDFGEHGREFISSELGLLLMRTLADKEAITHLWGDSAEDVRRGQALQRLLEGTVMKILPMENEGGRKLVESGKMCERKNGRGVDPNRNWPLDWGRKEPDYDPNEEYPGTKPFSEPEVQLVHGIAQEFQPRVWLNVHSGMEAMFTPWDHKAEVPADARAALAILQRIRTDIMGGTDCQVGSGGKTVGYLAHGTATDYMFEGLHVPMAFTWEIYGDFKAHFDDCFRMFNPLDKAGVDAVLKRWLRATMRLVELMPTHPALANSTAWAAPAGATTAAAGASGPETMPAAGKATSPAAKPAAAGTGTSTGGSGSGTGAAQKGPGAGGAANGGQGNVKGPSAVLHKQGPEARPGKDQGSSGGGSGLASGAGGSGAAAVQSEQQGSGGSTSKTAGVTGGEQRGVGGSAGTTPAGEDSETRVALVASRLGFGSSLGNGLFSVLLAVAGFAVVGGLVYRCYPQSRRGGRGGPQTGYQAV
ncbi:hypothetical protein CHLRE_11g467631v5 [Chlamydomonas reinhardtii]|uniref:Peptidase M14 domain-containing protein n=1 Tax=Chlamydomonas reinhardtii TaxID=3055 RepID=A0A2K3D7I2_CHLRE|nr:uncharacterized protein CHLRE_11g467631v5 [Chlamydomonas reinhardtii]PNW76488.1 hypothetical protein CHLRE_11g467631v5 [Chlamydomonas reinhardtii]